VTYKKFESHFRVPPLVLSTGFSVLVHLMWAQMKPLFLTLDERSRKTRSIHAPTWDALR